MQNNLSNRPILTTPAYWNSIAESTKAYWQSLANALPKYTVCTSRPSLTKYGKGDLEIRRCSTGGKWGKSADKVWLNGEAMIAAGYCYVTYTPKAERVAAKREAVYANDNH